MKKITLIASLLVVFAACQKADIRPRTIVGDDSTTEVNSISAGTSAATTEVSTPNALSGNGGSTESNPTLDPNNPNPDGGDITDPLRKKDQKDNK